MEQSKSKVSYSIIRYSPDALRGEIINIGLILYNHSDNSTISFLLDEKSPKLKAVLDNSVEYDIYKTDKESIEYYLKKTKDDISGVVGEVYIASCYDEKFIDILYKYFEGKRLRLSQPAIAYTKSPKKIFDTILARYIGETNVPFGKTNVATVKKYMKHIIESNEKLKSRIITDKIIKPIDDLEDIQIKVDFTFKNGRWNYMQAIPNVSQQSKNIEWFSKIELMLQNDEIKKSHIHLLYKKTDIITDIATYNLLKYLNKKYENVDILDIDKKHDIDNLCKFIENEAQILDVV
ncbi:MAG: DUF3037 domain-containing protein [Cellulosilyticum sp.]|nr:DUF3037 domain-containing protein [Cellulosilyticum sp.]